MKTLKEITGAQKVFITITAVMMVLYFSSCATNVRFLQSSVVPAAEGTVKVKKDNNKNYDIKISLSHLAEPDRLLPSKNTYVVCMESNDEVTKNIGQIKSSAAFLTGKLKGSFETVSALKPTKIFISAEDDGSVQYPGMQVVLTTQRF